MNRIALKTEELPPQSAYEAVLAVLPRAVREAVLRVAAGNFQFESRLSEIRLRADRVCSLTLDGRNYPLGVYVTKGELEKLLHDCCRGSVYAYGESLREGYLHFGGCRVGVAGRAVLEEGAVVGMDAVSSLVFRIPHRIRGAADVEIKVFKELGGKAGVLVYAPPGVGKTTLLVDFAMQLSVGVGAKRVAVIDSRCELGGSVWDKDALVDVLSEYPKAEGIEIATRTLSPEVIVCDEIGGYEEAQSILSVQSCGVPLVASAHGDGFLALKQRAPVRMLLECGIFGACLGIFKEGRRYAYKVDYIGQSEACASPLSFL
ncbi:MAG: hypothetical protein J6V82_02405 [Clostridia bacterium]|nr:hypothetical protein [Clostridia bacterium]